MDKLNVLGIKISTLPKDLILEKISGFFNDGKKHQIVTPNPEFLIAAEQDEEFYFILNNADLAVPDGAGLVWASRFSGAHLKRIAGVDLAYDICALAAEKGQSVFFIGGKDGVASAAADKLKRRYPGLKVAGTDDGPAKGSWEISRGKWIKGEEENRKFLEMINESGADILFVAFGHPFQEKWIHHNLTSLPSVKLAMGIGGSLDFISGRVKRAPQIFRQLSLEWLWRLIQEPFRWRRILDAVVVFPYKFFLWKYVKPHLYRANVVCMLYSLDAGRYRVFLVKRSDFPDHWQLPQGGTDGESLEASGAREIKEECGTDRFSIKAVYPDVFSYEFGEGNGKYQTQRHTGYKGQRQGLAIAEFQGKDSDIRINYWDHEEWKWVDRADLADAVHPVRKQATLEFIKRFDDYIDKLAKNQ